MYAPTHTHTSVHGTSPVCFPAVADSGNNPSSLEGHLREADMKGVSQPTKGCPQGVGAVGGSDRPHPHPGGGTRLAVKPSRPAVGGAKAKPKFYIGGKNGSTM